MTPVSVGERLDRLAARLAGHDLAAPELLKWARFSRNIMSVLLSSLAAVGALMAAAATWQSARLLGSSLERRAEAIALAAARAAFVPMALESREDLAALAARYQDQEDLAHLRIEALDGTVLAEAARPGPGPLVRVRRPVRRRDGEPLGAVEVALSKAGLRRELGLLLLRNAALCAGMTAFALCAALLLIGRMTQRLRALVGEAQLAEALRRSNEDLEQFAFAASHDLREPLRTISLHLDLLEQDYGERLDQEGRHRVHRASSAALRLAVMIDGLLEYSRLQTRPAEPEDVPLEEAADDALRALESLCRDADAELRREPLPVVRGNRRQLSLVIQNLVANALKFRRPGVPPRIELRAREEEAAWVVSVSDNGIGIEPRHTGRIFGLFQRLHPKDSPYGGTGIGLAIVKKIVDRHGGRIWVDSTPGEGAVFSFSLPKPRAPRAPG